MAYRVLDKGGHTCILPDAEWLGLSKGARLQCVDCGQIWLLKAANWIYTRWVKDGMGPV